MRTASPSPPTDRCRLVESHLPLVRKLAARLARRASPYLELDDLVAIGTEALLQASERFDPDRSVSFGSFAFLRVRGAMVEGLGRVGPHTRGIARRRAGRRDRGAPALPCPYDDARHAATAPGDLADSLNDALDRERFTARLRASLDALAPTEREIIERHYFAGEPLQDIGRDLGVSKSWTSRLHARALAALRAALEGDRAASAERPRAACRSDLTNHP